MKALPLNSSIYCADLLRRYRVISFSQLAAFELQTRIHSELDIRENHFQELDIVQVLWDEVCLGHPARNKGPGKLNGISEPTNLNIFISDFPVYTSK